MAININDLDDATLERLGISDTKTTKKYTFNVEQERQWAIKLLAVLPNLKQSERERVLTRAIKMNRM
tara:strand:- start:341 stop:541 length:201 start_codon:yes stop_codon:yes gene_type:complete